MQRLPPVPHELAAVPLSQTPATQHPAHVEGVQEVMQAPQSPGQVEHISAPSQAPLPQLGAHIPQSATHETQDSPVDGLHVPSPQAAQEPQSDGHDEHDSPDPGVHAPSPHMPLVSFEHAAKSAAVANAMVIFHMVLLPFAAQVDAWAVDRVKPFASTSDRHVIGADREPRRRP